MTWKLWDEDGTWLTMLQGEQGVMTVDDSEESEDENLPDIDYHSGYMEHCDLIHYENQQFLDMVDIGEQLRNCELIP